MEQGIVGFRFRPTQGELLSHHLKSKLQNNNYDEGRCVIPELNIYDHDPRDLLAIYNEKSCKKSTSSDSYFFSPRDKMRTVKKRKVGRGYWKETSTKRCIEDEETGEVIGIKRIFSFYEGNQRNARKTELALHEYHLNAAVADETIPDPTAFALCHVKKKKQWKRASAKKQRKKASPKKQQSKLGHSSYCGADSGSTVTHGMSEGIEMQKTNVESSLVTEGPIHWDNGSSGGSKCSPEQPQASERSPIINRDSNSLSNKAHRHCIQTQAILICRSLQDFKKQFMPLYLEKPQWTCRFHHHRSGQSLHHLKMNGTPLHLTLTMIMASLLMNSGTEMNWIGARHSILAKFVR